MPRLAARLPSDMPAPLLRATLTLMAGGALAQALPLLLGPLLTRLYSPTQFGLYHLFAAVAANVAVVACARYEHALPLAQRVGRPVSQAVSTGFVGPLWQRLQGLGATVAAAVDHHPDRCPLRPRRAHGVDDLRARVVAGDDDEMGRRGGGHDRDFRAQLLRSTGFWGPIPHGNRPPARR